MIKIFRRSDIDVIVIADDFKAMSLRERLELLGIAAGRVFEPIEALGYTQDELESHKKETFLELPVDENGRIQHSMPDKMQFVLCIL